jgi:prephenate dehydratase
MRVGYLGPPGTFAEEALLELAGRHGDLEEVAFPSVVDCFRAVRAGEVPEVLVPIENSIEGSVNQTLDQLVAGDVPLHIRAEVIQPIRHHLISKRTLAPAELTRVLSHPHATAQCQHWLRAHAPQAEIVAANSTADAVRTVSGSGEPWAAISTLRAAELYGCQVIARDIEDTDDNSTRFVLLGREPAGALGPGRFRTSIVCALERDRPGALLAILQEFAMRAVNLSKLESRPTKTGLGSYIFYIDIEGSRARDLPVDAAITAIEQQGVAKVTFLGSYPAGGASG